MRVLSAVLLVTGCATAIDGSPPDSPPGPYADETGEPVPQAGTATLRATTVILPAAVTKDAIVNFDHLLFPAAGNESLLALPRYTVIVSGTGDGFIRKVYQPSLEGDFIKITTSPASLADAVVEASFHTTFTEPLQIEQRIESRGTPMLEATITGRASLTPTIDIDFAIADATVTSFDLHLTSAGIARIEGTIDFTNTTHWAWGEEQPWQRTLYRRTLALGPLPVVVVAQASSTLAANAYVDMPVTFTNGVSTTLTVDAHTHYTPAESWTTTDASSFTVSQIGPIHEGQGRASLAVGIAPRVELAFYNIAGPRIDLAAQAGGFGAYCGPSLITGLQAALIGAASLRLEALTKMSDTNVMLFDKRMPLDELEQCAE